MAVLGRALRIGGFGSFVFHGGKEDAAHGIAAADVTAHVDDFTAEEESSGIDGELIACVREFPTKRVETP